ncbi:MAG: choline/ethanolamine kinase family protein [Chitinophagaceae bacterium]
MSFLQQDEPINQLIARIPVLKNVLSVEPLHGGLTNRNFCVTTSSGNYFLRISDPSSAALCINRENERINTALAYTAGIGAELIAAYPEEHAMVLNWIHGKTLHAEDIHQNKELLARMAIALKKLHSSQSFHGDFYFPVIRKKYLQTVLENKYFMPDHYLDKEHLIVALEKQLADTAESFVSCNNDLLAENFIDDGNKIWIIDYEYAGQNEASFEIGNLANELFLDDNELAFFCKTYWNEHLPGKIARAKAWSVIARYGWTLWASIQEAISPIDFDFRTWGLKKWNAALKDLTDESFTIILKNLKKYDT